MKYTKQPQSTCRFCRADVYFRVELTPEGIHYAKLYCPDCGRWVDWLGKPQNKDTRQKSHLTPESLDIHRCQVCLRPRSMLGNNETLDVHHIHEVHENGLDIPENCLVVCTFCHKDIHAKRKYLFRHFINDQVVDDKPPWD